MLDNKPNQNADMTALVKKALATREEARNIAELFCQKVDESPYNPDLIVFHGDFYDGLPNEHSIIEIALVFSDPDINWFDDGGKIIGLAWEIDTKYEIETRILTCKDGFLSWEVSMLLERGEALRKSERGKAWMERRVFQVGIN